MSIEMRLKFSALLLLAGVLAIGTAHSAPATAPKAAVPASAVDPDSVPVSTATLPAFPYLDWPTDVKHWMRHERKSDFDRAYFVAGDMLVAVEGRLSDRNFRRDLARMSRVAAWRNYENAIKALGGVRIDKAHPEDKAFTARNGGDSLDILRRKLAISDNSFDYGAYLIRTPEKRVWIALGVSGSSVFVRTLEEKTMAQTVAFTKADEMKAALDKQGYIALYVNFDTDKAELRGDGKPAVGEIAKLLTRHPALKISVEGHTDNTGDARRNKVLSEQRAATIVTALKAAGIDAARLKSAGFGADKPIADNRSEEGRAANRRVELVKL